MPSLRKTLAHLALASSIGSLVDAHTWIEQYQVVGPNGSYIGDGGYSRGYVARTDPTFDGDANILWMLPELTAREPDQTVRLRINSSDPLCHPNQRTSNYSNPEYPKLKVAPGNYVAMKYYENGHVTLPWNQHGKPQMGGTVFVFGTTDPIDDEKIVDVMKWTTNGKGGDGRGFLMTAQNYDDGRCHQINDCVLSAERQVLFPNYVTSTNISAEQWCETDLLIPTTQKAGSTLTTYWVWQWPTAEGSDCIYPDGKDEYYTTCADFDIIDSSSNNEDIAHEVATNTLLQEDFQTAAVSTYASRTAITISPSVMLDEWKNYNATRTQSLAHPSSFLSGCSISAQSAAAAASAGITPSLPTSCPSGKWATGELFASISSSVLASARATPTTTVPTTAPMITPVPTQVTSAIQAASNGMVTVTIISTVTETESEIYSSTQYSFVPASSSSSSIAEDVVMPTASGVAQEQAMSEIERHHPRHFLLPG